MWNIQIDKLGESPTAWEYAVEVREHDKKYNYDVIFDKEYYATLAEEGTPPLEVIQQSFLFLLEREPPSSILSTFNLKKITSYFPQYEEVIRNVLKK